MPLPSFIEERFPTEISYGSSGGPAFSTNVFESSSGYEQRTLLWAEARARYNIATGIKDKIDMDEVLKFFFNVRGRSIGFRFKDWADYQIAAQNIGTGNGSQTQFNLVKTYVTGAYTYTRRIYKPVQGSILNVTVGGSAQAETVNYTVNYTTGVITFLSPPAGSAAVVVGSAEFDVPVRFDTDELPITHEAWLAESLSSIPLVELKLNV